MKIELRSQGREMHLFLTSNMTSVTSSADQQFTCGKVLIDLVTVFDAILTTCLMRI